MANRLLREEENEGWERSDFPIVCETCLGPNPYVRMQKIPYGGACHISGRPYTVFRWQPGNEARFKKTVICQEVAKAKNICQVCMLDLEYGLPVQVRDQALALQDEQLPQSDAGREFALKQMEDNGELDNEAKFGKAATNDILLKLARTQPYYKRNQARVCSFFVKGKCNRGAECPYRHEMPNLDKDMMKQDYKDRYYGVNDPVAKKMLARADKLPTLAPPEDRTITTLFVGGVTPEVTEQDLRDAMYAYGEIESLRKVQSRSCAFVTFRTRSDAERAAAELGSRLLIKGNRLFIKWGRPAARERPEEGAGGEAAAGPGPGGMPGMATAAALGGAGFGAPGYGAGAYYPSMDPNALGANPKKKEGQEGAGGARGGPAGPRPPMGGPGAYAMGMPPYGMPYGMPMMGMPAMGMGMGMVPMGGAPGPAGGAVPPPRPPPGAPPAAEGQAAQ